MPVVLIAHLGGIDEAGLLVLPMMAFAVLLVAAHSRARAVSAVRRRNEQEAAAARRRPAAPPPREE